MRIEREFLEHIDGLIATNTPTLKIRSVIQTRIEEIKESENIKRVETDDVGNVTIFTKDGETKTIQNSGDTSSNGSVVETVSDLGAEDTS